MPARRELKFNAKQSMSGRKPSVYLVALVYIVIGYVLTVLMEKLLYPNLELWDVAYEMLDDPEFVNRRLEFGMPRPMGRILYWAVDIMSAMVGIGFSIFSLRVSRGLPAGFGELFDAFGMFFKFLWLNILMGILAFLWSLLFVIPGIIARYRYSMAIYIMIDNPEFSALECIRRSKEMMLGHKGELFVLDLSFIGWAFLTVIPFVSIYVSPYMEVTRANFYNALAGFAPRQNGGAEQDASWRGNDREPWD